MLLITAEDEVRQVLAEERARGKKIGLVPTMGALHQGHLSLVSALRPHCDYLCMWIFLNPMQFNTTDDYQRYPRDLDRDLEKAESAGVDLVFAPPVDEIYPRGVEGYNQSQCCRIYAGDRSWGLCGSTRPGHFDGVVHVVSIFFNILQPDLAVFGEKDYQQVRVIQQLVDDLHYDVKLLVAPIVREESGLALSSRNELLGDDGTAAFCISRSLKEACDLVSSGECSALTLQQFVKQRLEDSGLRVDYVEIVDRESLKPLTEIEDRAQLLVAAFAGDVRLIDNIALSVD